MYQRYGHDMIDSIAMRDMLSTCTSKELFLLYEYLHHLCTHFLTSDNTEVRVLIAQEKERRKQNTLTDNMVKNDDGKVQELRPLQPKNKKNASEPVFNVANNKKANKLR
jgi:hypothetical protein